MLLFVVVVVVVVVVVIITYLFYTSGRGGHFATLLDVGMAKHFSKKYGNKG